MDSGLSVALVNDTSIYSKHFGCQLVGQTFREQFKRVGFDLKLSLPKIFDYKDYANELSKVDLVVVNGEGSIHHNLNFHLLELATKYPSVLVNCVYQENDPNPFLSAFKYVSARESLSALEIQRQGVECAIVPDAIFASSFLNSYRPIVNQNGIAVTDAYEKQYTQRFFMKRKDTNLLFAKKHSPASYIEQLLKHKGIVAGRFHAAVACSVLGIPFSTWDSNTWKTKGMMNDMGVGHLHADTRKEAERLLPEKFDIRIHQFAEEAKTKIYTLFDTIYNIASNQR